MSHGPHFHVHGPQCHPHRRRRRGPRELRHFVRARLHRRLFVWFGASILVTGLVVGALTHSLGGGARWREDAVRLKDFAAGRFERAWDDRAAL